jgi:hypothetical protein
MFPPLIEREAHRSKEMHFSIRHFGLKRTQTGFV